MCQNSCRVMLCTTKKFVKSVSTRIKSKCCEDGVAQTINGKSSGYFLSLFLCWCDTSSRCVVQCCTFCHGRQKSPKKKVLHITCWVLRVDCAMHRNFSAYCPIYTFFPKNIFLDVIYYPGTHFLFFASAWRFEVIGNGSRLTRKWHSIRAGTELNAMTGQLV